MKPQVLQQSLQYRGDELTFKGRQTPFSQWLSSYHRPIYFYDLNLVKERIELFKENLPAGLQIHYAMKANSHTKLLSFMKNQGLHVDVVSGGEIKLALAAGFEPNDIIFSGVGKTKQEIRYALELGINQINVESLPELDRIAKIAKGVHKKASVSLRLNPDIDIGTHPYIATGLRDNKFGLELSLIPEACEILHNEREALQLVGISFHLGSQMLEVSSLQKAFVDLKPIFEDLRAQFSSCSRLDFGGGLGINYKESSLSEQEVMASYSQVVKDYGKNYSAVLQTEPGRWLVAHAGVYVAQVQYVKKTSHKNFLILDGGMNHLIRPALYDAHHEIFPIRRDSHRTQTVYDVVGPICESSDFLAKDRRLQEMKTDEFVAIADTGAYGAVMASHYNHHDLPLEVVLD